MARAGGLYSRVIAWLKVLLPLAALALLSTLFLLSRSGEPLDSVPFADALRAGETALQGVSSPHYTGVTEDGGLVTLRARRARPLEGGDVLAEEMVARMQLGDGSTLLLEAVEARLREGANTADLDGGVRIESSLGYVLTTESMVSALDRVSAESRGPVQGAGPAGTLEAGAMRIAPADEGGAVQISFTGGVKLIYQPPEKDAVE